MQANKVEENRMRRHAERRGYEPHKLTSGEYLWTLIPFPHNKDAKVEVFKTHAELQEFLDV